MPLLQMSTELLVPSTDLAIAGNLKLFENERLPLIFSCQTSHKELYRVHLNSLQTTAIMPMDGMSDLKSSLSQRVHGPSRVAVMLEGTRAMLERWS